MATATLPEPKIKLKQYLPPPKGYTRFISIRSGGADGGGEFVVKEYWELNDKNCKVRTKPPVILKFKDHICDCPPEIAKMVEDIAQDLDDERLDYMTKIVPAKLLGELLEDDENAILDKRGQSYGGRGRALSFIQQIAHFETTVNPPEKGTIEEAKIKITTEWQRRLQKWGYTRTGELLNDEKRIAAMAAKHKMSPEAIKEILEQGLLK